MSSRHCSPAVTISGTFPLRPPGTAGSCGKREAGREERAGKQQLLPWMSTGLQEGCGKGGSSLQAWGAEKLKRCESGQSRSAPAAQPCSSALPDPKGSTGVKPRVLQGALLHQRAAKGVYSPFMIPFTHPEQFALPWYEREWTVTGFPETTNNLLTT